MLPSIVKNRFDSSTQKIVSVYADEVAWSEFVDLIPNFTSRANELFGEHLPHINFYMFAPSGSICLGIAFEPLAFVPPTSAD
jgi:hypothetical protein